MIMRTFLCLALLLVGVPSFAERPASDSAKGTWIYGIGIGQSSEAYRGFDQRTVLMPMVGYRGARLTVMGPFVSYRLQRENNVDLSMTLAPRFWGFDEGDSAFFQGMQAREDSIHGGFTLTSPFVDAWRLKAQVLGDLLGRSKGIEGDLSVSKPMRLGFFQWVPEVGVSYWDARLSHYYYGVTPDEATLNRPAYQAFASLSYRLGATVRLPLLGGMTALNVSNVWLDREAVDSPLTDTNRRFSVRLSYTRRF